MDDRPSPAVAALREQFGDPNRRPPDITRKITACVACRKQKIKCFMNSGKPPCTRCRKRSLPCTVNKSLQTILESDAIWKDQMELKMQKLVATVSRLSENSTLPVVPDSSRHPVPIPSTSSSAPSRPSPQPEKHLPYDYEITMDPDSGPAALPGSVVTPISITSNPLNPLHYCHSHQEKEKDLISRGVIPLSQAEHFLKIYQDRLDHFLYRIMGDRRTLSQVRTASSLLTSAICTVAALHAASPDFEKCYQEFVELAAMQTFSKKSNLDDVRGLCIAAFWLSGISWTCIGAAVRIATELQLHRSIFKALGGDRGHYSRTRLYYLVYVCDHQSSIPYGRPPMTGRCDAIQACLHFLDTEHAVQDDVRLVSQVQLWSISTDIYERFGIAVERPLDIVMIEELRRFGAKLDGIRADWAERLSHNRYVGNYPKKGLGLHYHFAKLYLYSMAFRGIGQPGFKSPDVALDIDEMADSALLSATAIIRTVIGDIEIQDFLNGLPTYFDVMIAFAVVFVLKVSTTYVATIRVDTNEIRNLVERLIAILKNITSSMHSRHLLVSVARGVEILVERCFTSQTKDVAYSAGQLEESQSHTDNLFSDLMPDWNVSSLENFSMGEFDFLLSQGTGDGNVGSESQSTPTL